MAGGVCSKAKESGLQGVRVAASQENRWKPLLLPPTCQILICITRRSRISAGAFSSSAKSHMDDRDLRQGGLQQGHPTRTHRNAGHG